MPDKRDRALSGWRARRLIGLGGLIVRDGAAFRIHQWADERSRRCGRLPAHVVARLKAAGLLAAFLGDPDRLVQADGVAPASPVPVPLSGGLPVAAGGRAQACLLDQLLGSHRQGIRLRAAAGRFLADYQRAVSPGRLRADNPSALAAAGDRLLAVEQALGPDGAGMAEMLVLDRFSASALRHRTGAGPDVTLDVMLALAGAYGLITPDQEAGRAFASS